MRRYALALRKATSIALWFPALLAIVGAPAHAQDTGEITVLEDVLPAPCPTLLPTPDGRRVVCIQPVPKGFQWREKFPGKPLVRVAVVDLDGRTLLAVRDFDAAALRFAVGKDALYVVNNDSLELQALSLADLGVMKSIQISEPIEELYVIADRLLCDMRSRFRLDLPELTPSETWRVVPPLVGHVQIHTWSTSLDGLFRSRGPAAIFRAGCGWHIDGVLYDDELRPQLILDRAGPTFDPSEYWSPESAQYIYWSPGGSSIQEYSWKVVRASREYAVSLMAVIPRKLPPAELPVTLRLVETGSAETLAEVEAGVLPGSFVIRRGMLLDWNEEALINTDGLNLKAEERIDLWPIGKQKNVPISIGIAGNRALAAFDGNLIVWDFDRELLEGALGPQRLVQKQSQLLVDVNDTTTLTHELIQPGTGRIAVNEITLDGKSLVNETVVRRLMRDHNLRNEQDIQRYLDRLTPQFLRLVGRAPRGLVGAHKVAFTAEGTKSAIRYTVLFEIPEDVYGAYFRAEVHRVAQRAARNRAASEPQRRAQRAAADARQQQRDAEFRWNLIAAFLSSPYVLIPIVLGVMAVGWRTRAPLLNGLAGAGRRVRGAGVRNRVSGLIGIGLGGAILVSFWMKGGPEGAGAYAAGQIVGLIMGALMFFGGFYYLFKGSPPVDQHQRSSTVPEPVLERSREGGDVPATDGIWEASQSVIAVRHDDVYRRQCDNPAARLEATQRLAAGESPQAVFGRSGQRLPLDQIRGLGWVPAVRTVLIYRGRWRDKWRLTFDDEASGERLFQTLAARLSGGAGPAVECRIGPDDLHLDPRFGLGFFLAIVGLFAIASGALDGVGQAQYTGRGAGWVRTFEVLGAAVGVGGAIAIGSTALAAGVSGLVWWYRNRPLKWMVRRLDVTRSPVGGVTVERPQAPLSRTKLDQLEDAILKFTPAAGGIVGGLIAAGALRDAVPLLMAFVAGGAVGGLVIFIVSKLLFLAINPKRDRGTR